MPGNETLWKKSIYFEVVNTKSHVVEEAMTLVLPPNSFNVRETQRVNRNKTFGGVFEDDYGPDNPTIEISGTSGNTDPKLVYRGPRGNKSWDGPTAVNEFRNRIMRYKHRIDNYEEFELRVYDFSAVDERVLGTGATVVIRRSDSYVTSIDEFQIQRNRDKPLFFDYNIRLFVLRIMGNSYVRTVNPIERLQRNRLQTVVANIRRGLNRVNEFMTTVTDAVNRVNEAISLVDDLEDQVNAYVEAATNIVRTGVNAYYGLFDIARFPSSFARSVLTSVREAMDTVDAALDATPALVETIGDDYASLKSVIKGVRGSAAALVTFGKSSGSSAGVTLDVTSAPSSSDPGTLGQTLDSTSPEDEDSTDQSESEAAERTQTVVVQEVGSVVVTEGTSYEAFAAQYYGDPALSPVIMLFNGKDMDEDISPGDVIRVPRLNASPRLEDNAVYTENPADAALGSDVDARNGGLSVGSHGDYIPLTGIDNLIQALNLRLSEQLGSRLRLTEYGLDVPIGSSITDSSQISYLMANIEDTVLQDPRVEDVSDMAIRVHEDKVYVSMTVRSISRETLNYTGQIIGGG